MEDLDAVLHQGLDVLRSHLLDEVVDRAVGEDRCSHGQDRARLLEVWECCLDCLEFPLSSGQGFSFISSTDGSLTESDVVWQELEVVLREGAASRLDIKVWYIELSNN